jgi:transposase
MVNTYIAVAIFAFKGIFTVAKPGVCPCRSKESFVSGRKMSLGLIPKESSSGGKQRMGSISKQGSRFLRYLLVEAANSVVRFDPGFRKYYAHRCHQKHRGVAKVAVARKLAVRLYWMLRTQMPYPGVVTSRAA